RPIMLEILHLLAQAAPGAGQERLQRISTELQRPISWFDVWLVVGFLILAPLIAWFCFRRFGSSEPREAPAKPQALFQELCDGHELRREDRELLESLAKREKLDPAAKIFLAPELLGEAAAGQMSASQKLKLAALRRKLFDELSPA